MKNVNQKEISQAKEYLFDFDQILNQMSFRMLDVPISEDITVNFIRSMIPHHLAAVYMSQNLLKYSNNTSLQEIAQNIITTQTKGIQQMKSILNTTQGYGNSYIDVNMYQSRFFHITTSMVTKMVSSIRTHFIDMNYIKEMIPHHEGAVLMCENLLQYHIDPRLKQVAQSII